MNPVLNVKWMDATLVIEEFAMVYVNLGYVNPFVFWYQSDYLRSPALKEMYGIIRLAMWYRLPWYVWLFTCKKWYPRVIYIT